MEPHRVLIFANSGPSGPEGIAEATQILRAGNFLPVPRDNPRNGGPGKGDYEHEVLIRSRTRRRFGDFAAAGKVTRRPQAAKSPAKNRRNGAPRSSRPTRYPKSAPSSGPFGATFPPGGRLERAGLGPAPTANDENGFTPS